MVFKRKPYTVKLLGRAGLLYNEHGKVLTVDSEMLAGPNLDIVIYADSIHGWNPPYDKEVLSEADKRRIMENLSEALKRFRIDWA